MCRSDNIVSIAYLVVFSLNSSSRDLSKITKGSQSLGIVSLEFSAHRATVLKYI